MELKQVEIGQRFLYKTRPWRDGYTEVTLIEISPNKKVIKVRYANGNEHWEDKAEFSEWELIDRLPPKTKSKNINCPPIRDKGPRRNANQKLRAMAL